MLKEEQELLIKQGKEQALREQQAKIEELKQRFKDEPADDSAATSSITIRLPSGQRVTRRFLRADKVE